MASKINGLGHHACVKIRIVLWFSPLPQFINRVMETVPLTAPAEGAIALPADTKALQRHLCVVQLARSLGLHHTMDQEHKLSLIHELKTRYRHGLEFGKLRLPSGGNEFSV